jgi:hypothetical protein
MLIPCPDCNGECGALWHHVQMDSHDLGMAIYGGGCRKVTT